METKPFDRLSYALGLSIGYNFQASGIDKLNVADFAEAVEAVLSGGERRMSSDEAKAEVQQFFGALEQRRREQAGKMAEINKKAGEQFLAENGKRAKVHTTATGLQYEVITEGTGCKPKDGDAVTVHYTGTLIDGTVFDSSVERGEPATFGVNQVIPGWVEALKLMSEGAKWRLYIPSALAYGPKGAGGVIGPNQTLIFEVELIKVGK